MNINKDTIVVVTRHEGALEWLAKCYPDLVRGAEIIRGSASIEDVRGKIIIGNVPLSLAAEAEAVYAIEFSGPPPRGIEYTAKDMEAAGARLQLYRVIRL